jgi:hypothetical protein
LSDRGRLHELIFEGPGGRRRRREQEREAHWARNVSSSTIAISSTH